MKKNKYLDRFYFEKIRFEGEPNRGNGSNRLVASPTCKRLIILERTRVWRYSACVICDPNENSPKYQSVVKKTDRHDNLTLVYCNRVDMRCLLLFCQVSCGVGKKE